MRQIILVAKRELAERIRSRSFLVFSILGPLIVLGILFVSFTMVETKSQKWNVLITDPKGIMDNKIMPQPDPNLTFSFANGYLDHASFDKGDEYKQFDAMVEINEKVLSNKISHVFYRTAPTVNLQIALVHHIERRLEEVMVQQFTELSLKKFREIKQPITFSFVDVNDPENKSGDITGWAGVFFSSIIYLFIGLFGMTILRSISAEKSNRIIEVLLATVKPRQLLTGKIIGIGIAAFIQFVIWIGLIGIGLYLMRQFIFPDMYDGANLEFVQLSEDVKNQSIAAYQKNQSSINVLVELVFDRINLGVMLPYFFLFFIAGYLFYGSFFASIGATAGTESDGQQFILPILIILGLSAYGAYYAFVHPDSNLTYWMQFIPFTAPGIVMVKLTLGYPPGEIYLLWLSLFSILIFALAFLTISGRLYKNGVLQFGHRLRVAHFFRWMKNN